MRRVLTCAAAALMAVMTLPALAEEPPPPSHTYGPTREATGELLDGDAGAVVTASETTTAGGTARRGAPRTGNVVCRLYSAGRGTPVSTAELAAAYERHRDDPNVRGVLVLVVCEDTATGEYVRIEEVGWTPAAGDGVIAPEELARLARARLAVPPPEPKINPAGDQTVNLASWLFVRNWDDASREARAGGVWARATATPVRQRWHIHLPAGYSDDVVECAGPGTPYDPTRPPEAQSTDCAYTFVHASDIAPGGAFEVTVTVWWAVAWTSNEAAGGSLGEIPRSTTLAVRVAEHQALNTYPEERAQ